MRGHGVQLDSNNMNQADRRRVLGTMYTFGRVLGPALNSNFDTKRTTCLSDFLVTRFPIIKSSLL